MWDLCRDAIESLLREIVGLVHDMIGFALLI